MSIFRRPRLEPTPEPTIDWDAAEAFWESQGKSQLR